MPFRWCGYPIGTAFNNNKVINTFDELKYFTNLNGIATNAFNGCTNLVTLNCENVNGALNNLSFANTAIKYLKFNRVSIPTSGGATSGTFYNMKSLDAIWFKELTTGGVGGMRDAKSHYNIITSNYVPGTGGGLVRFDGVNYVPDNLVSSYQSATYWSNKTIRALSTLPTYQPTCPWLDELRELGYID